MKTILIHLPEELPLHQLYAAIRSMGLTLRQRADGTLMGYPANPQRHGNSNVVPMPRRSSAPKTRHEDPDPAA